jgi:hypothetical protein
MALDLKGKQVEAFCDAMLSAFPGWSELERMIEIELGESLERIVEKRDMESVTFDLVKWARAKSRLDDLLTGALRANDTNTALKRLAYELSLSSDQGPAEKLESILMPSVPLGSTARWREQMAAAERCICRIEIPDGKGGWRGVGTGSLVGADVVLTNAHVAELAQQAGAGRAQFDYAVDGNGAPRAGRVVAFAATWLREHSPEDELDFALVDLAERVGEENAADGLRREWLTAERHTFKRGEPVFILQHPQADRLKIGVGSVADYLMGPPPRVRYSTNTMEGSSGSPCFNMNWELVALHRAGGTTANSGVPLSAILDRVKWTGLSDTTDEAAEAVKPPTTVVQKSRVFIAYRRAGEEAALAGRLHKALAARGHDVFIDVSMQIGTDWAREIQARIEQSDAFVIFVSEESVAREMVQVEVRAAHNCHRRTGKPAILPVRVRYDGALDYEIEHYLQKLQYVMWSGDEDDGPVIDHLIRAIEGTRGSADPPPDRPRPRVSGTIRVEARPVPAMDPRFLSFPTGTMAPRDPLYVKRQGDAEASSLAKNTGQTVIIKGPRQRGKSSLLVRYLAECKQHGKQIVLIDLQQVGDELATYPDFLRSLATAMIGDLQLEVTEPTVRKQNDLTRFVQNTILAKAGSPLVLAIDEVDRVSNRPYKTDFFGMLRSWHNQRASPQTAAWLNLDLALVLSTEPNLLIQEAYQSPFNVGHTIELDTFTREQCHEMNRQYPANQLKPSDVEELYDLLGGHPYLTRVAYHRVHVGTLTLPLDLRDAADAQGPFGDHLRAMLSKLAPTPELTKAFQRIIAGKSVDDSDVHRLRSVGLVAIEHGKPRPANLLYTSFFRDVK